MSAFSGHCLCGGVQLELDASAHPVLSFYCHCDSCTRWQSTAVDTSLAYAIQRQPDNDLAPLRILRGADKVKAYTLRHMVRHWCGECGSHLYSLIPAIGLVLPYPSTFRGSAFKWRPTLHLRYAERVIDVHDGLPKFHDTPKDLYGSGIRLSDAGEKLDE